jgi:hypothetical protein
VSLEVLQQCTDIVRCQQGLAHFGDRGAVGQGAMTVHGAGSGAPRLACEDDSPG